ncbi:MAG: MBL fold metallo-hydrolase, partial [bacterium]|nr:MBL fold metallo-hydrolase [bacterium]
LTSPVAPGLSHVLAGLASWPASWIAWVAHTGASLPLATVPWPSGPIGVAILATVLASGWLLRRWLRAAFPRGVPGGLVGIGTVFALATTVLWLVLPPDRRSWPPTGWLVIMCDVGQGDALLVRSGEGAAVVVDAGPEPERVDRCITDARVSTVPAVVLTHFHADHVDGLAGVLRGRAVPAIYVSPVREPIEQAIAVSELAAHAGIPVIPISAGDERVVGGLRWRALWPRRVISEGSVPNNASVVLAVDVAGRSVLLTGDVELAAQAAILPELAGSRFDVVKVPHHGSRDQDPGLAPLTAPSVALISVGKGNTYGHPAAETVSEWQTAGALVFRTDISGDVAVVTAGDGIAVVPRR